MLSNAEPKSGSMPPIVNFELFTPNDDSRPVFLAGNFNQWRARDERFRMEKVREGHYRFILHTTNLSSEPLEYKYMKDGWEGEELGTDGFPPVNRSANPLAQPRISDLVPKWKTHTGGYNPDFYPEIEIVSERFHLPQLKRRRRISLLLPHNYYKTNRRYPVLYLQDGQNLFEEDAPYGTWGIDKQLAAMSEQGKGDFIVVAIDHGGKERIKEFSPYDSKRWGEGLAADYARFLAETLKPYIDHRYRTMPERPHTGVGGSSMGGLVSIYAGMVCPAVFSKFMIFSPALWVSPQIYFEPLQFTQYPSTRIYLYAGGQEGSGMVENSVRFKEFAEKSTGFGSAHMEFNLVIDPKGQHNEARWGKEFPKAAAWLFG